MSEAIGAIIILIFGCFLGVLILRLNDLKTGLTGKTKSVIFVALFLCLWGVAQGIGAY